MECLNEEAPAAQTGFPSDGRREVRSFTNDDSTATQVSKRRKLDHNPVCDDSCINTRESSPVPLSPDQYTIGWICALAVEMAAAKAMLEAIHTTLPKNPDDPNSYTFGSTSGHNVVIACLPSGHYGTNNAASVASNMRRSFPAIQISLMVGIGGGVPGNVDIRLGDVVVGDRVIQYDMGKATVEGFIRTGIPIRPAQALLTAVNALRANYELKGSQIPLNLAKMLRRYPTMTEYSYPASLQDWLFDSKYCHTETTDNCENCDMSQLVPRPDRDSADPVIHYGIIASGNQVLKDATTRDQLAEEINAICFEMEAAGLMDSFSCLVIRGICDYADSHKNKQWQKYAATTAAAYATELLSVIPSAETRVRRNIPMVQDQHDRHKALKESLNFEQIDSRRSGIRINYAKTCEWLLTHPDYLDWLNPDKVSEHHGFLWIRGKPGAGKSTLLNFACKKATEDKASTVISFFFNARGHILERSVHGMYRSLLFHLLKALPRIDVFNTPEYEEKLDGIYQAILTQNSYPEWPVKVLQDLLRSAVGRLDQERLILFVDALDECDQDQVEEMIEYFEELGQYAVLYRKRLTICFSSRHYPHIEMEKGRALTLEQQEGHEKDIATYVKSKLKVGSGKSAREIKATMQAKADGIFMWIVLVVDILNKEYRAGRIFAVRKRLDTIPTKLSDLFKEILWRDQDNLPDLRLCIQWILFSKRPLRLEEYYFAAVSGLDPDEVGEWDQEDLTKNDMIKFVLSSSKGLAEITKAKNPTVQFIHESVREFFLKDGLPELWPGLIVENFPNESHEQLKKCCYTYMQLRFSNLVALGKDLPKASSPEAKDLRSDVLNKFPFLEYAARYVLYHSNNAVGECSQKGFLEDFPLKAWINLSNLFERYEIRRYRLDASLLYILADNDLAKLIPTALTIDHRVEIEGERHQYPIFAGLANGYRDVVKALLPQGASHVLDSVVSNLEYGRNFKAQKDQKPVFWAVEGGHDSLSNLLINDRNVNETDRKGKTLLSRAAEKGHESIVKLLLEKGADMEIKDYSGQTILSWVAKMGYEPIVKLLLEKGANTESKDNSGQTILSWAAKMGHESIVKLLLEKGADMEIKDYLGRTPLSWAAVEGHKSIVKLLLEKDADMEIKDNSGQTILSWVTKMGRESIVKLLLEKGANMESQDNSGQTPLSWAAEMGRESTVKPLLEKGADMETKDRLGKTPLLQAAARGHESIVKLLLEKGADMEAKDEDRRTPLSRAAEDVRESIVKLLLEKGADTESQDNSGQTSLSWAAKMGHESIVKLLLEKGANIESQDNFGQTPLSWAAEMGHETTVKLLLKKGANIESQDNFGQTPLSWAAKMGHKSTIQLLLEKGADMEAKDGCGQTPLSWAAKTGRESIVKLLLEKGADIDIKDHFRQTPLSQATQKDHKSIIKLLLEKGANTETKDQMALSWASRMDLASMMKLHPSKSSS